MNLRSVNKENSHNVLANILLQEKQEDREEFFQIIKERLTKTDYLNLLKANEVTDLLPILFDLEGGIDQETAQAMFEKAVIDGYPKAALLLFNKFPKINLSFKTDIKVKCLLDEEIHETDVNPLENLIYKIHNYELFPDSNNDNQKERRNLLLSLLGKGDLSKLASNLLYDLFSSSAISSDHKLIESLLNNKTYTLQHDVKETLKTIADFDDIPDTATILIRHVLKRWNQDNLDDLKSISEPLVSILPKMKEEDKMREVLSLILQKDLVTQFNRLRIIILSALT